MSRIAGPDHDILLSERDGAPWAQCRGWRDAFFALGFLHGRDRGAQIELLRTVAQGRICERLSDTAETLALDRHFRRLGFARDAARHIGALAPPWQEYLQFYAEGLNRARARTYPRLYRLVTGPPEPFAPHDVLALLKLVAYAGLAEGQRMVELFVLHALRRGVSPAHLRCLLPALGEVDTATLRGLPRLAPLYAAENLGLSAGASGGSNAWAVSGARSAAGAPLLANDPHLEVNRLPAVVYDAGLEVGGERVSGATLPGLPGFICGRNRHLAWGVTYSCADTCDFFVEQMRGERVLRDGREVALEGEDEIIRRRRHDDEPLAVRRSPSGTLEHAPAGDTALSWRWVGQDDGGLASIAAFAGLPQCTSAAQARECMRRADIPTLHMLFADDAGNIAYQLIGAVPRRRRGWSGLEPAPGEDSSHGWDGMLDPTRELPQAENPADGLLVVANDARTFAGYPGVATCWLGAYRGDRIDALLRAGSEFTPRDFQTMHYDVLSLQARRLLPEYLQHLPDGDERRLLAAWDCRYTPDSLAATLFERLHLGVHRAVFGAALGLDWWSHLVRDTGLRSSLMGFFDRVLAQPDSPWLPAALRRARFEAAIAEVLQARCPLRPWGEHNAVHMTNLFFGGRLPRWLRMDLGPYPLPGNHATICQGTTFDVGTRRTSFAACYRMVADLADGSLWRNYPGGPDERRLSRRYRGALSDWRHGRYRK